MTTGQSSLLDLMEPADDPAASRLTLEMDRRLRKYCLDVLAQLREAETLPWSLPIARCNWGVFPIHSKLFPQEEGDRMRAELIAHYERLGWKG